MKRLLVISAALALVGGLAPWNGEAGAAEPVHRPDGATYAPASR